MPRCVLRHRASLLLALLAGVGCAHGSGGRLKGGLLPVAGVTPAAVEAAARPRKVALLVGIDHVADPFWPALRFAAKDAHDLARVLKDPAIGAFDEVRVLDRPEETTRAGVLAAVRALAAAAPRPEDTVVVFFSGHGTLAPTPAGGLERVVVTTDTREDAPRTTGLRVRDLLAAFDALPSRRKLLILATCHSGGGKGLLPPNVSRLLAGLKGGPAPLESVSRATLVLSASEQGQPAREDDRLQNDVYTHFLIEALTRGADANGDGAVTASEAHDWARRRTYEFTRGRQIPTLEEAVAGADPVILAGRIERPGLPVLYSYADGLRGYEVREDGRPKGRLPGNVVLDGGERDVQVVGPDGVAVFDGDLQLEPGERRPVEALLDAARPRWSLALSGGFVGLLGSGAASAVATPLAATDLSLRLRDEPLAGLEPSVDLLFAGAGQSVGPARLGASESVTVTALGVGVALTREVGPVHLWAGPHLAWERLARRLQLQGAAENQSFATLLPGATLGAAAAVGPVELQLQLQLHYLPLVLDGQVHSIAEARVAGGLGWRF